MLRAVLLAVAPGIVSATADVDYMSTDMAFSFPEESVDGDRQCMNITILDDTLVEGDETFNISVSVLTTGLRVTADEPAIIVIEDDEGTMINAL